MRRRAKLKHICVTILQKFDSAYVYVYSTVINSLGSVRR